MQVFTGMEKVSRERERNGEGEQREEWVQQLFVPDNGRSCHGVDVYVALLLWEV